ncbi:TonB-dependent receptor [Sphingosinicellaceae bacterium]|nr:TonB-dependent receptor [Sphingosinicellaceae bacterium]
MKMPNLRLFRAILVGSVAGAALCGTQQAWAQTATKIAASSTEDAQDIIVTGTRRTDRSLADSPSPVDIIGADEIAAQPAANMLDVIKNIVPSFFVSQNTISDASSFVRAPSLRGLPADEILVQLNGKRYNRSALVQVYSGGDTALGYGSQGSDISAIPSIAVKSLQILREGATAQYGSDAIGGVLNYGLRDDAGFELQARYGQYYDHGDGASKQVAGNAGVKLGDRGFINVSAEYDKDGETSRGATRPIAVVFAQQFPALAPQLPNYPGPVQNWGSSRSEGYKLLLNSAYEVTDNSKIYLFVNIAHNKGNESFNYRSPISAPTPLAIDDGSGVPAFSSPGANGAFGHPAYLTSCPTGNVTCPNGGFVKDGNVYNFTSLYPAGFTPRFIGKTDEAYGTLGYKGSTEGGFTYDLSGTLSRNALELSMTNSLNASFGPDTQTDFKFGKLIQTEFDANLDLSYPIEIGLAAPLTLSAGAEYRREQYEATVGDLQSYSAGPFASQSLYVQTAPGVYTPSLVSDGKGGFVPEVVSFSPAASGYGGTSPSSAGKFKQTNYAIYGDAETDLTKALSAGLAARYEHYNTFGNAFVVKFNAIYKFADAFSLRGTVGTGFHAPSPGQSNVEILTTNFVAGNQVQTGTYQVGNPISQFYGAKPLKPEKSTNFGLGAIIKPADALTLTVDAYSIRVRNRIGITQPFDVTAADIAALPALSTVGVGGNVNYFTNGFNTKTDGVDVVGSYRTPLLDGKLNLTLAYNYNKSKVTKFDPAVISDAQISDISNFAPKHRVILSGNWQIADFTLNVRENYYSAWSVQVDYPGDKFGSKFTSDLDLSYTFKEHFTLTLGAINLFNTKPDRISATSANPIYALTNSTADGQIYPRSGGPFGINGGFWYARVRVKY